VRERASIAHWMLCPSDDIRSSNYLEQVQNQYQVQGLEIDHSLVCWDLDLRREDGAWCCYDIIGSKWSRKSDETELQARINSYRVLLTRSRKTTVIFVPRGDLMGQDETRPTFEYDRIASYLLECGVQTPDGLRLT